MCIDLFSNIFFQPPTPETDYPKLSPRELSPKEGYSPDGSYKQFDYAGIPSADQGCASPGTMETSMFDVPGMVRISWKDWEWGHRGKRGISSP